MPVSLCAKNIPNQPCRKISKIQWPRSQYPEASQTKRKKNGLFWDVVGFACLSVYLCDADLILPTWDGGVIHPTVNSSGNITFYWLPLLQILTCLNLTANPNAVLLFPESDNTRNIKYQHISEAWATFTHSRQFKRHSFIGHLSCSVSGRASIVDGKCEERTI